MHTCSSSNHASGAEVVEEASGERHNAGRPRGRAGLAGAHSLWSKSLDRSIYHGSLIYIHQLGRRYHQRPTLISHIGDVSGTWIGR